VIGGGGGNIVNKSRLKIRVSMIRISMKDSSRKVSRRAKGWWQIA
jgi:hypothetical protein